MGPDAMILVFCMLSFKPTFHSPLSLSSRDSSSSSLSAIKMVSSAYLMLFIFLPATFILVCASSRTTFLMMYSACLYSSTLCAHPQISTFVYHFPSGLCTSICAAVRSPLITQFESPPLGISFPLLYCSQICPWDFPGKNIGVGCHFFLQGIFLNYL